MNLLDILKYVWQGQQGQNAPFLTPGYNGQENPASVIMNRQQGQGQMPAGMPQQTPMMRAPMQQNATSGGLKGLLQNPNFLQGIAQIAMSQGTYGGARGAGFQNQMAAQEESRRNSAIAEDESARDWARIKNEEERYKATQASQKPGQMAQVLNTATSLGIPIADAAEMLGVQVPPELSQRLDSAIAAKQAKSQTYIDVDPESETYGQIVASPDPENPNHYPMDTKTAVQLSKSLAKKSKGDKFYVAPNGKLIPETYAANIPTEARLQLEGPFDAQQAISRAGQVNKPSAAEQKSLQEELADLTAKGKLTPQEESRKKAIEYALGYVANQYGSGFKLFNTPEGNPVLFHPGKGTVPVGGDLRPAYSPGEREEMATLDEMINKLNNLERLANNNKGSIGPIEGRIADVQRKLDGSNAEVNEMFRIADGIADDLLRAKSGAQINEQEYNRLRQLTPNPRMGEGKFFSDLKGFKAEMQRVLDRRSGKAPLVGGGNTQAEAKPNKPKFSKSKWAAANPRGDVTAAAKQAQAEGYEVID